MFAKGYVGPFFAQKYRDIHILYEPLQSTIYTCAYISNNPLRLTPKLESLPFSPRSGSVLRAPAVVQHGGLQHPGIGV